jgi:hypothetical protein
MSRHGAVAAVLLAAAAIYLALSWSDVFGVQDDGAIYLLMARHYSAWLGPDAVAALFAADAPFPPFYPWVLALAGGGQSVVAAHVLTVACLVAALGALYAWLLALGSGRATAAGAVAIFALAPGTLGLAFNVLSEPLYVALSVGACVLFTRTEARAAAAPDRASWGAVALVAAAILTRGVGLTLLPALAVFLWRRHGRRGLPLLGVAVLPHVLWSLVHESSLGYAKVLAGSLPAIAAHAPDFLRAQGEILVPGLASNLFLGSPWLAAPLGILAFGAAAVRAARLHADAIALFCNLGLLVVWPFPSEAQRLTWVCLPLLLGSLLWGLQWLAARAAQAAPAVMPRLPALLLVGLALAVAPGPSLFAKRWFSPEAAAQPAVRHVASWYTANAEAARQFAPMEVALAGALRDFGARLPPGSCSFSTIMRLVAWYARQRSILPPPPDYADAAFDGYLKYQGCTYFVMISGTSDRAPTPFYPLDRLGDRLEILDSRGVVVDGVDIPLVILARLRTP